MLDDVLAQQAAPSLVADFASRHARHQIEGPRYRRLMPLSPPGKGEQYAFQVDLDKCSGCKSCVAACHSLNGLDADEAWRETGLLVSDEWRNPFQQVVTTACHHCVDPACLNGCPVLAYDKDPITGIVRHLDDQCIGCQYCILKCPYEVPNYSVSRGIVRKCDMCASRLLADEAPACVQACPNEAIRITLVDTGAAAREYRRSASPRAFLPDSPSPAITLPTTRYVSNRALPRSLKAGDHNVLRPQPPHWPLVFMLVLTQMATGLFAYTYAFETSIPASILKFHAVVAVLTLLAGLGASVLHLGRPLGAWRSFLGWRRSWLSREIVIFGACVPLSIAYTSSLWLPDAFPQDLRTLLGGSTLFATLAGVFCSAMIYHDTCREYWTLATTGPKFFGTALLLGSAGSMLACLGAVGAAPRFLFLVCAALMVCGLLVKLSAEERVMSALARDDFSSLHRTALLLSERFGIYRRIRVGFGIAGGVCFPALLALHALPAELGPDSSSRFGLVAAGTLFCLAGELIERWLFFAAVQPMKMPGAVAE